MNFAYYNENDPKAAAWLRDLIKEGHIARGEVDERDIRDVTANDLRGFNQHHFFAGIGGWSAALRLAGWPDNYEVWTGSCPCQPFSAAGKRAGTSDERHLWPAWQWLIKQYRPNVIFGEQVASKDGISWLDIVSTDMEGEGYAFAPVVLPACGFGAPHQRQRLWFVADSDGRNPSEERKQRGWKQRLIEENRISRELADDSSDGRIERRTESVGWCVERSSVLGNPSEPGTGRNSGTIFKTEGEAPLRPIGNGTLASGSVSDVAESSSEGLLPGSYRGLHCEEKSAGPRDGELERPRATIELDHADNRRPSEQESRESFSESSPVNGFWRDAIWIRCRDGKARPIKSSAFPLAHGISGRVAKLRGIGNAIVPQVAAEVIKAYLEK